MEFHSATTVDEALGWLAELGEDARILAGGTDVMVQYQRGELAPRALVHIEGIPGLDAVRRTDGKLHLGALVTHRRIVADPELPSRVPALAEAAATVGGWQTQEVGTVVGNLCNASPAADTVPPLLVADAEVHLSSRGGRRRLRVQDLLLGRRHIARRPEELVTGIELQALTSHAAETYLKVGPRGGMEVALAGLAVRLTFGEDRETVTDARVAACSVGPVPFRATEAERTLIGNRLEPGAVREAGARLTEAADPIDDPRATAAYRRRVLAPLLERAVAICRERARGA